MKHDLTYQGHADGYADGLDDVYRCSCGASFAANGGVFEAFEHGRDAGRGEAVGVGAFVGLGLDNPAGAGESVEASRG